MILEKTIEVASSKIIVESSSLPRQQEPQIDNPPPKTSWSDLVGEEEEEIEKKLKPLKMKPKTTSISSSSSSTDDDKSLDEGLSSLRLSPEQTRPNTADSGTNHGGSDNGLGGSLCEESSSSTNSVVCSDSGRGSEADDNTGTSSAVEQNAPTLAYHFHIPTRYCGRFIGAKGANVNQLKSASKCRVMLKEMSSHHHHKKNNRRKYYDDSYDFHLCIIEGTRTNIEKCLELIRERFPLNEVPDLTLDQVNTPTNIMAPALQLASGVMNEVRVATIVSPSHLFLQQPSHPTFPALDRLNACMYRCYNELATPELNRTELDTGVVCVALYETVWYRVQIISYDASTDYCDVKFLDYGGYMSLPSSVLRKIRSDFLTLPFQAIECYLANITPLNADEMWPTETVLTLEEILAGKIGTASWIGVAEDGIPMVHLFVNDSSNPEVTINVNRELVDRNAAAWIEHTPLEETIDSTPLTGESNVSPAATSS